MKLTAIAAMGRNRVIGNQGKIPWHIPEDMKFFRDSTLGGTVIMGRRTWESLSETPLPRRDNWVMSRKLCPVPMRGATQTFSVPKLIRRLHAVRPERAFVIGGGEIYRALLPYTDEILLTVVDQEPEGDVTFPEFEDQFGEPEILRRIDGVAEWRRYTRITK